MKRLIFVVLAVVLFAGQADAYQFEIISGEGDVFFDRLEQHASAVSNHSSYWEPIPTIDQETGSVSVSFEFEQNPYTLADNTAYLETTFQIVSEYGSTKTESVDARLIRLIEYYGETENTGLALESWAMEGSNSISWSLSSNFSTSIVGLEENRQDDMTAGGPYEIESVSLLTNTPYTIYTYLNTDTFTWFNIAEILGLQTEFESYEAYFEYYYMAPYQHGAWASITSHTWLNILSAEQSAPVPEPATIFLFLTGLGLASIGKFRKKFTA